MVYVSDQKPQVRGSGRDRFRSCIDLSLEVDNLKCNPQGEGLLHWQGYSTFDAGWRATYLDWLATGKSDDSYHPRYMLLYLYGLERRFFLDNSDEEEKRHIVAEVERLRGLFPPKDYLRKKFARFLDVARLLLDGSLPNSPWQKIEPLHSESLLTKLAITERIEKTIPLNGEWMYRWFRNHPRAKLLTPAIRCPEKFRKMFCLRFDDEYPDGYTAPVPRKKLKYVYEALSGDFQHKIDIRRDGASIADIATSIMPLRIAQKTATGAMQDINSYSRFIIKDLSMRDSIEAYIRLPCRLRTSEPSKAEGRLRDWARVKAGCGGEVSFAEFSTRFFGDRGPQVRRGDLISAADVMAELGFGLVPDPRYVPHRLRSSEPVFIFELDEGTKKLEDASLTYLNALNIAALKACIAHVDGVVSESERKLLKDGVKANALSEQERRRLEASIEWLIVAPPSLTTLCSHLKRLDSSRLAEVREEVRAAIVGVLGADDVNSREIRAAERIYNAMGLGDRQVRDDLASVAGGSALPPITPKGPGLVERDGFSITLKDSATPADAMDRPSSSLAPGVRTSSQYSKQLLAILLGHVPEEGSDGEAEDEYRENAEAIDSLLEGLAPDIADMVSHIVERRLWQRSEIEELAGEVDQLAASALKTINEWARSRFREDLIAEGDEGEEGDYKLNASVATKVTDELERQEEAESED